MRKDRASRCALAVRLAAVCALAGAWLLGTGPGQGAGAPAASRPAGRAGQIDYVRLERLRAELLLQSRHVAGLDCDKARTEAVFAAVRKWYDANKGRLHAANVAANQARAAGRGRRGERKPDVDAAVIGKALAAADARVRALHGELIAAVEAELLPAQRAAWRTMGAAAEGGAHREWVYAPLLTAEQAKAVRDADSARSRAMWGNWSNAARRAEIEADFDKRVAAILTQRQLAAVRDGRTAEDRNLKHTRRAERDMFPQPATRRHAAIPALDESTPVLTGLAGRYPGDTGIAKDPDVVFACDFEAGNWPAEWGLAAPPKNAETIAADAALKFQPYSSKALRVTVDKGGHYGLSLEFPFRKRTGSEPEEIHFRYYLRLADDWRPARGGKLPGIGGTYGRGGWGGRPSDGINGWSARGLFTGRRGGKTATGFYCYHADQRTIYGDHWVWDRGGRGFLANNRWYCIEQYARLNAPGKADGILRGWIDGRPAFEKTDIRMRDAKDLKIETVWLNVYFGGTWTAKYENHLYLDSVVIARKYIGPMTDRRKPDGLAP